MSETKPIGCSTELGCGFFMVVVMAVTITMVSIVGCYVHPGKLLHQFLNWLR